MRIWNRFLYAVFALVFISSTANAARYHDRTGGGAVSVTENVVTLEDIITRTEAIESINNLSPEIPNRRKNSSVSKTPIINTILDKLDKVGPVGVGVAAVVAAEAAGYLIDELQNQVLRPEEQEVSGQWASNFQGTKYLGQSPGAVFSKMPGSLEGGWEKGSIRDYPYSSAEMYQGCYDNESNECGIWGLIAYEPCSQNCTSVEYVPVPDPIFADKIYDQLPALPNPDLKDLFQNEDGNWDLDQNAFDDYDDWLEDFADSQPNYHYDKKTKTMYYRQPNGGTVVVNPDGTLSPSALDWSKTKADPSNYPDDAIDPFEQTDPNESPNTGTGITTGSETTTTTNPDGSTTTSKTDTKTTIQIEFPVFCKWASAVCTFIDWMRADPELPEPQELPHEEIDPSTLVEDFDSGLGEGSCPANVVVDINGTTYEYDWSPACGVASNVIKPIFITIGLFIAAVIITGFRFKRAS